MSKSNHSVFAHEIAFVVSEINRLDDEEIKTLYGIEIDESGGVYDVTYNNTFSTVGEWAAFNVEQDNVVYEEHFHGVDKVEL